MNSADKYQELIEALEWALPLAELAMEQHRQMRLQCGHNDLTYTTRRGVKFVGLSQAEWDRVERARRALAEAQGRHVQHVHVAGTTVGKDIDECARCGRDLRDPIHTRL